VCFPGFCACACAIFNDPLKIKLCLLLKSCLNLCQEEGAGKNVKKWGWLAVPIDLEGLEAPVAERRGPKRRGDGCSRYSASFLRF